MRLDFIIISEGAFNNNGSLTIVNTYNFIQVGSFKDKVSLGVAIRVVFDKNEIGSKHFEFIVDNRQNKMLITKVESDINIPDSGDDIYLNIATNMQGLSFPEEGDYDLKVMIDGELLGTQSIKVKLIKPQQDDGNKQ